MSKLFVDLNIALRSLLQHSRRTHLPRHRDRRGDRAADPAQRPVDRHSRDHDRHGDHAEQRAPERRRVLQDHRGPGRAGGDRLPARARRRDEVAARDGLCRRARPRLGQAGVGHRLDAGGDQRHRHPAGAADSSGSADHQRQARRPGRAGHDPDLREPGREAEREGGRCADDFGADPARRRTTRSTCAWWRSRAASACSACGTPTCRWPACARSTS